MRHSVIYAALSVVSSTVAVPLEKRADYNPLPNGDIDILNYALTLEYLERTFYEEGLANYTEADFEQAGFGDGFYANLKEIYSDEASHVDFLAGALGDQAIPKPMFSFPVHDAKSFVTLSSVLEGVGVSAYLGAAAVIADKKYVPIAGSILTVEARHSSYIRAVLNQLPFPKPYDTPLNFNQVFSLAAQFVTAFGEGTPELPFMAFPPLSAVPNQEPVVAGSTAVQFVGAYRKAVDGQLVQEDTPVYAVIFSGLDTYYARVEICGDDYVLHNLPGANHAMDGQLPPSGQAYIVLSTADGQTMVSDENTVSGVAILEIE
jgi:rubrerythrin